MSEGNEPFTIEFAREAERQIRELPAADARMILQKIKSLLSSELFKGSKTRIKRPIR
jgi:mRNA-degrading endonuclease RelE of RelBE toxin-antitoxin system